ncbi:MAG: DUF6491 family protein [Gammaproteobacteria bacterium]|nr:DUF6491 family protein [Gammaproteobacteria bacterium]
MLTWMTRLMALAAIAAAGCASAPQERETESARAEALADILAEPLDEDAYSTPRRCISESAYRDFEPLGDRHVLFKGPGGKLWLNELRGRCPGLERSRRLVFRTHSFQICDMDQFQVTDWFLWERYQRWPWHWPAGDLLHAGRDSGRYPRCRWKPSRRR